MTKGEEVVDKRDSTGEKRVDETAAEVAPTDFQAGELTPERRAQIQRAGEVTATATTNAVAYGIVGVIFWVAVTAVIGFVVTEAGLLRMLIHAL